MYSLEYDTRYSGSDDYYDILYNGKFLFDDGSFGDEPENRNLRCISLAIDHRRKMYYFINSFELEPNFFIYNIVLELLNDLVDDSYRYVDDEDYLFRHCFKLYKDYYDKINKF